MPDGLLLVIEANNVGMVRRVLNCDGVYHADRSDWRQSTPGGPGNCRPPRSLICGNRRYGPSGKPWFLIGVKTHFLSSRQPPPKLPSLQAPPLARSGDIFSS
jgi:hypothetical protein